MVSTSHLLISTSSERDPVILGVAEPRTGNEAGSGKAHGLIFITYVLAVCVVSLDSKYGRCHEAQPFFVRISNPRLTFTRGQHPPCPHCACMTTDSWYYCTACGALFVLY